MMPVCFSIGETLIVTSKRQSFFMPNHPRYAWPVFLLLLAAVLLPQSASAQEQYRIGVLASRSKEDCRREWSETARYLGQAIKNSLFEIQPLAYDEINAAVEGKSVDFLICNPAIYIELAQNSDMERLATLKRLHNGKTIFVYGSVIVARSDAAGIRELADLRKKSFMGVAQNSFGGWLMALREFKEEKIDPHTDFARLHFRNSHETVVQAVRDGRVDAGAIDSGILERMAGEGSINPGDFKILNRDRYPDSSFPFAHSTRLYPEWTFSKLEDTPEEIAEKVTLALLSMPHNSPAAKAAGCAGWTYPVSYKAVFDCLSDVQYGPYKGSGIVAMRELWRQYGKPLATTFAGIALLFLFCVYALIVNRRLQRSNRKIKDEVAGHQATMARLSESQHRAEQLLKIIPSAVITLDRHRLITSWNNQAEALTGYTAGEVIGKDCLLCMEQSCGAQCPVLDAEAVMPILGSESTIRRRDGSLRMIEKNADLIYNELGVVVGAIESFKDITERKNAEEALVREKELAQQYLDIAGVIILVLDIDQTIRLINKKGCAVLGRSAEELIGRNWFEASMPPSHAGLGGKFFSDMLTSTRDLHPYFEAPVLTHAGEERLIAWHTTVIRDADGAIRCTLSSGEDITERRLAEEALRESELKFRALTDSAADAILMMDSGGAITLWNSAAEKILGWQAQEVLGSDLHLLLAPSRYHDQYQKSLPLFRETGRGNAVGKTMELVSKNRFDEEIPVELSLSSISLRGSWYAVGILRDISRRKQTEQALREAMQAAESANAAKSQFMANMSHEIRTPMNGVMGMTGLLLGTSLTREQQDYAEAVRSSADSLLSIVNDILDFSKIEAGKMELEIIDFDLQSMLESLADMLALKAHEKGLEYVWMASPEVPRLVKGDPGRLRQVLVNLVGNAVKFTHAGTVSLVVNLEHDDSDAVCLRFEVSDTGIGIPAEKLGSLFQPFVQADPSTTRKYGGTGLGLSICRQLVGLMNGAIGVTSTPGQGSVFWFTALLHRQTGAAAPAAELPMADIRGSRMLIVDDNAINRQVVAAYLRGWNCRFEEAADAQSALEQLHAAAAASDPFAVAMLDMQMPGMDGETLGRAIRQDPELQGCALVMMTSAGSRGDAGRLKALGFAGYLAKPVKQAHLYGCLAAVLGLQQQPAGAPVQAQLVTSHMLDELQRSKIRILVAEDNATNQKVAVGILKKLGYRADAVANGLEAVRQIERIPYDLIFMDVQMPEMDGLEATQAIRGMSNGKNIPIIAMTAAALQHDRDACISAGMNDYVAKPIQPLDIAEKIFRWLDAAQSHGAAAAGQAGPGDEAAVFDKDDLIRRLMGDENLLRSILAGFIKGMPKYLAAIRDGLAQQDAEALRRSAHTLKGSAANVGAHALSAVAQQIEQAGAAGDFAAAAARMDMLDHQAGIFIAIASPHGVQDIMPEET
jgi:PAS domain S-box-containing protein